MPDWVTTAMNSIGDATIGHEDSTEETTDPGVGDPNEAENCSSSGPKRSYREYGTRLGGCTG